MAHFHNPSIIGASGSQSLPYSISRSLRFNSADSTYLSRTPGSAGNQQTWTLSMWVKRGKLGSTYRLFDAYTSTTDTGYTLLGFSNADKLIISGWNNNWKITTQVFRDVSAWYHIVVAFDVTQSTGSDRIKFYVNGTQITAFDTDVAPAQNTNHAVNGAIAHAIGRYSPGPSQYFDGYIADVYFLDGTATTPSTFAMTDAVTGQWVPKTSPGIGYGTNGFYLEFKDNSATTASTLGKDTSGKGNNWTPNNFSVTNTAIYSGLASGTFDQGYYKPSNMWTGAGIGNTSNVQTAGTTSSSGSYGTSVYFDLSSKPISASSVDLWILKDNNMGSYAPKIEINGTDITPSVLTTGYSWVGVTGLSSLTSIRIPAGAYCGGIRINGTLFVEGQTTDSVVDSPNSYGTDTGVGGEVRGNYCTLNAIDDKKGAAPTNGNLELAGTASCKGTFGLPTGKWYFEFVVTGISGTPMIGVATENTKGDLSAGSAFFLYRGSDGQKQTTSGASSYGVSYTSGDVIGVAFNADTSQITFYKNNTSQGAISVTSGNTYFPMVVQSTGGTYSLNFGQRAFAYTAPSGFKALVDTNLTAPTIAKPANYFNAITYVGSSTPQTISGLNFTSDLIWIKSRSHNAWNILQDSIRGFGKTLFSNSTNQEVGNANDLISSVSSTGFSVNTSYNGGTDTATTTNGGSYSYAAWAWLAASSNSTNTSGTITSTVRANATAGFSIVTWSYGTVDATVGHGLGVAPSMIIAKGRTSGAYGAGSWIVYHSGLGTDKYIYLNSTNAEGTNIPGVFSSNSSTVFEVNSGLFLASIDYVAYCFAPVAGYSAFGSYTGNGSSDGPFVFTGHRSRWLMVKRTDVGNEWTILDTARSTYNEAKAELYPSAAAIEGANGGPVDINSNGFKLRTNASNWNALNGTYIYMALAESPFQYARAR